MRISLFSMKIRESLSVAPVLQVRLVSGNAPLVGWRRPFSSLAERLCTASRTRFMKKSTQPTSSDEPMGIFITTGFRAPVEPLVREYVWGPVPDEPVVTDGKRAA